MTYNYDYYYQMGTYFKMRGSVANGVASSGSGLANLVLPLITQKMIVAIGWKPTLRILALQVDIFIIIRCLLCNTIDRYAFFPFRYVFIEYLY